MSNIEMLKSTDKSLDKINQNDVDITVRKELKKIDHIKKIKKDKSKKH